MHSRSRHNSFQKSQEFTHIHIFKTTKLSESNTQMSSSSSSSPTPVSDEVEDLQALSVDEKQQTPDDLEARRTLDAMKDQLARLRETLITDHSYPRNLELAQQSFDRYMNYFYKVLELDKEVTKEEAFYWINADLHFRAELLYNYVDEPNSGVTNATDMNLDTSARTNFNCALCELEINSRKSEILHINGKKHQTKLNNPQKPLFDTVCRTRFSRPAEYIIHLEGDGHRHVEMSAWYQGLYRLYCHLCQKITHNDQATRG